MDEVAKNYSDEMVKSVSGFKVLVPNHREAKMMFSHSGQAIEIRKQETDELMKSINVRDKKVIIISGPVSSGKTRALEALHGLCFFCADELQLSEFITDIDDIAKSILSFRPNSFCRGIALATQLKPEEIRVARYSFLGELTEKEILIIEISE